MSTQPTATGVSSGSSEPKKFAFIDEYGDVSLELSHQDVSRFFIVTAILVDASDLHLVRKGLEEVLREHQTIRSQKLDEDKRVRVLKQLSALPFTFYSVVIDKALVSRASGLRFRNTFYKYAARLLYSKLYGAVYDLDVTAEEFGRTEFMAELTSYLRNHGPNLSLFRRDPKFKKDSEEIVLKLADCITGTLGRCYDPTKLADRADELLDLLKEKAAGILPFPFSRHYKLDRDQAANVDDPTIRRVALDKAYDYIERNAESADPKVRCQIATLHSLLYRALFSPEEYLATQEMLEILKEEGHEVGVQWFRSEVIGPLREDGLLIASRAHGPKPGYKLPQGAGDLRDFFDHAENVIVPLLRRVQKANTEVALATGRVNLLGGEKYALLRKLAQALTDPEAA